MSDNKQEYGRMGRDDLIAEIKKLRSQHQSGVEEAYKRGHKAGRFGLLEVIAIALGGQTLGTGLERLDANPNDTIAAQLIARIGNAADNGYKNGWNDAINAVNERIGELFKR